VKKYAIAKARNNFWRYFGCGIVVIF